MKVIIEAGQTGTDNQKVNIDGLIIDKEVPLLINFDHDKIIGNVLPYKHDGAIYIDIEYDNKFDKLYPAIGFQLIKGETNSDTGITEVLESKLLTVSLCTNRNTDNDIQCIEIQKKFKQ